jgi:hypothetical protein
LRPIKLIEEYVWDQRAYLKWKRRNVSFRGMSNSGTIDNGGGAMLGDGLYTAALSNKRLARQYGEVYFVVNARPTKPKIFRTLNDWEIWEFNTLITDYCRKQGVEPDKRYFFNHTSIRDEMLKLGFDGIEITGREYVNYTPDEDEIRYYTDEDQVMGYYEMYVLNIW